MNITQLIQHITFSPVSQSVMLEANHGVGKSQVARGFQAVMAKNLGLPIEEVGFIDFRLSQNDVGDLKGVPFPIGGRTFFAPPAWFPMHEEDEAFLRTKLALIGITWADWGHKKHGIILLDEFNRASKEVLQVAFELVLDRRLNGLRIPDGWRVIAAVNGNSDIYQVGELDPALLDRFDFIDFRPTVDEWLDWAKTRDARGRSNVHQAVTKYIENFADRLDPTDDAIEAATAEGRKLQSRRSWDHLSACIYEYADKRALGAPDLTDPANEDTLVMVAKGFVGSEQAVAFTDFVKNKFDIITPDTILDRWSDKVADKVKAMEAPEQIHLADILVKELAERLTLSKATIFSEQYSRAVAGFILNVGNENVTNFFTLMTKNEVTSNASRKWYQEFCKDEELGAKARTRIGSASKRKA